MKGSVGRIKGDSRGVGVGIRDGYGYGARCFGSVFGRGMIFINGGSSWFGNGGGSSVENISGSWAECGVLSSHVSASAKLCSRSRAENWVTNGHGSSNRNGGSVFRIP